MSRPVTLALKQALNAPETGEVFIVLLTIEHEELAEPLYFSLDAVNTVSRGHTFLALPFDLTPPEESGERPPAARLTLDNIDRQIVALLRSITTPLTVKFEVVRAADPETVEAVWDGFKLRNLSYNALTLQGDLTLEDFLREPFPSGIFSPAYFPALF